MIKAIRSYIASKLSVSAIVADFHTIIAKLEEAEKREQAKLAAKASQILQLEAQKIGHALESERAAAIRAKLEALVK